MDGERSDEAWGDLRRCIEIAQEMGELEVIEDADPHLEIGALYELSLREPVPPILLFQKMRGCAPDHRIALNVRWSRVLNGLGGLNLVRSFRKSGHKKSSPVVPRMVRTGPVFENTITGNGMNIRNFPTPVWHADDGGAYIGTECMIIMRDPDNGWVNVGTYRVQVQDETTLTVFIDSGKHGDRIRRKYWAKGEQCPTVVCVGQAPVLGSVASATAPENVSEFAVAGGRLGRPIELVDGPLTGIPFPADAELVYEGFMPLPETEQRSEGPFGEWPGYYAATAHPEPVFKVAAIHHRNAPIMVGQPPVKPTYAGPQLGSQMRAAALWDELEAAGVPGIKGVWKMQGGGARFINVVAIEQLHPGHAKMAGLVAAGCGSNAYLGRMVIIVDDDIDITSMAEVMWAIATRWDPKTQTDIIDGCWTGHIDPLLSPDKRMNEDITNSRIIIYAVRPYHWREQFPKVNTVSRELADAVATKWRDKLSFLQR